MKKELVIVAVIAVIIVSAAVAITVANMSDKDQGNVQRYEINDITYSYDPMIAQSTISSSQADETEIKYDDGSAEKGFSVGYIDLGPAVLFSPPTKPWTLDKVRVVGEYINLSGDTVFALEIWDKDYNLLYKLSDYSLVYFNTTFKWTEIDIPDITITGDFYVCIFDRTSIIVGADTDNPAMRSYVVIRDPKSMAKDEGLNWMIRAVGS
jgi:hypothetical protein